MNKHNVRVWGNECPNEVNLSVMYSSKVNIWCNISCRGIIGPKFFREETVTRYNYNRMLRYNVLPNL